MWLYQRYVSTAGADTPAWRKPQEPPVHSAPCPGGGGATPRELSDRSADGWAWRLPVLTPHPRFNFLDVLGRRA